MAYDADTVLKEEFWRLLEANVDAHGEAHIQVPAPGTEFPVGIPVDTALFCSAPVLGDGTNAACEGLVELMQPAFKHARVFPGPAGVREAREALPAWTDKKGVTCTLMRDRADASVVGGYVRDIDGAFLWYWGITAKLNSTPPLWMSVFHNPQDNCRHGAAAERIQVAMGDRVRAWSRK
jgi:hypothetical protein